MRFLGGGRLSLAPAGVISGLGGVKMDDWMVRAVLAEPFEVDEKVRTW